MHTYLTVIHTALILFPLIAFLFTFPYMIYNYHKYGSVFSLKVLIVYSFILYMMTVYFLVILPLPSRDAVAASAGIKPQFIPFHFIHDIIEYAKKYHVPLWKNQALFQVLFNILMFVPFGMYLRYYFRCTWKKALLVSFFFTLFLETTQLTGIYGIYPKPFRMFDVDDLMANTSGGMIGYWIMTKIEGILPSRKTLDEQSYQLGKKVSLIRRTLAVFLDLSIAGTFAATLQQLIPHSFLLWMILYFIGSVLITKKYTPGMAIMSLRLYSTIPPHTTKIELWQIVIRYLSIFSFFYLLPSQMFDLLKFFGFGMILVIFGYIFFLVILFVKVLRNQRLFFSKWSRTIVGSNIALLEEHKKEIE
ncbi:hypothetical protein C815_01561 [Firmicutes bacterium M10-2]|nr:hypothetical protein C815_01561 [Firmicutes bacterium M10-2]